MSLKDRWSKFKAISTKKKVITGAIALAVVLLVASRVMGIGAPPKPVEFKQTYIPVNAETAKQQTISTNITLSGKVQADKESTIVPKTPGRVQSISVNVGDEVEKDQVLFSLDKSDVQASYDQAAAGYMLAQAGYEMNLDKYEKSKTDYENAKQLFEAGAISKTELEMAEMGASDAVLRTAEAQLKQAKAGYDAAAKVYQDMDVKSPIAGIVTSLDVRIGEMVTSAAAAASVVDLEKVFVTVSISEKIINNIQRGQEVTVEIPSAGSKIVKGKIDSLSLAADARTGKYALKIHIDNTDHVIKPGMFARVELNTLTKKDVIAVPSDAVIFHAGKNVAYVVTDNIVTEREVTVGLDNGDLTEIVTGIEAGEVIVTKGMNFVKEGSEIKVIELDGVKVEQESQENNQTSQDTNADNSQAGGGAKQ